MTFSSQVKDELGNFYSEARHCCISEIAALFSLSGEVVITKMGARMLVFTTEKLRVARKYFTLLIKTFNIHTDVLTRWGKTYTYILVIKDHNDVEKLAGAIKLDELLENRISYLTGKFCCRRSFLRGAFLCAGSVTDPEKSYHLEIACSNEAMAAAFQRLLISFGELGEIDAKIVTRKNSYIVYVKESAQISLLLNIMEAHVALMDMENHRIFKEMRNTVNRRVNCETANINKTVNAATKQIEDIEFIKSCTGYRGLSESLIETAELRLENPEATLAELGKLFSMPVGKSGVNHRLKKLCEYADSLRMH